MSTAFGRTVDHTSAKRAVSNVVAFLDLLDRWDKA